MKSIYMDARWGKLQQEKEKGEAITHVFHDSNGRVIYPFIKRKAGIIDGIQYYDLVTPRGQCGLWIEDCGIEARPALLKAFDREFKEYCNQEHIIAEYIRFSPWIDYADVFSGIYNTRFYGYVYCNDLTKDFFHVEYSSTKRNDIRKAQKSEVEIVIDETCNTIDDFLRLRSFTASKYEVSDYYALDKQFVTKYFDVFPGEIAFANAFYQGKMTSSTLILLGENIAHLHFAGNDPEYGYLQGNSLLIYKASLFAAEKGKRLMDLGGAKDGSSVEKFKNDFTHNARKYPFLLGTKIREHKVYDMLAEKNGGPRDNYFPAYRRD